MAAERVQREHTVQPSQAVDRLQAIQQLQGTPGVDREAQAEDWVGTKTRSVCERSDRMIYNCTNIANEALENHCPT